MPTIEMHSRCLVCFGRQAVECLQIPFNVFLRSDDKRLSASILICKILA
jgi:hypothetical protein